MHVHTDTQVACVFVYWKRKTENCSKGKKKVNLTVGAPGCIQYHQPGFGSMACGQGVNLIQIQLHHTATAKQILISRVLLLLLLLLLLLRWACMLGGVISIAYCVKILWRIAMILIHMMLMQLIILMMQLLTWLLLLIMAMDMMGSRTWVVVAIMMMIMVCSMSSMRAWVMWVTWLTVIIRK